MDFNRTLNAFYKARAQRRAEEAAPAPNEPKKPVGPVVGSPFTGGGCAENQAPASGAPGGAGAAPEGRREAVVEPAPPPGGDGPAPGAPPADAGSDSGHSSALPESRARRQAEGPAPAPNEPETPPASEPESPSELQVCVEEDPRSAGAPVGVGAASEGRRVAGVEPAGPAPPPVGDGLIPGDPPAVAGPDPGHAGAAAAARFATDHRAPAPAPNEPEPKPAIAAETPEKKSACVESTAPIEAAPPGAGAAPKPAETPTPRPAPIHPDRLVFDPSVSTDRPVVRGTRSTTAQICARRNHPDLPSVETVLGEFGISREDFLACIEYEAHLSLGTVHS